MSEEEWKEKLTPEQYEVCRCSATEPPFQNEYWDCHDEGKYHCVCCDEVLFESEHKFDSGTGWPSFDRAIDNSILFQIDYKIGYARNEIICSKCGSHLGHMFKDGPKNTTGERHCINSLALNFKPYKNE